MGKLTFSTKCPVCQEPIVLTCTDIDPKQVAGKNHSKTDPVEAIMVYKINSEQIKRFLTNKARSFVPETKIEVVPRYCEKKKRNKNEPHHSYASLRIALSDNVIDNVEDTSWFGKVGESKDNVHVKSTMFTEFISRYSYNPKDIDAWLKSYKNLEDLEDGLGMTEEYINDLKLNARPRRIQDSARNTWVIFAAAAENVLKDMLADIETHRVPGKIEIHDVYPISKDIVEFVIYMHPKENKSVENPHVRQILMGEAKAK